MKGGEWRGGRGGESSCGGQEPGPRAKGGSKGGFSRYSLRTLLLTSPVIARRLSHSNLRGRDRGDRAERGERAGVVPGGSSSRSTCSAAPPDHPRSQPPPPDQASHTSRLSLPIKEEVVECSLCVRELSAEYFPSLVSCDHKSCYDCLQTYLKIEISESRVSIDCPQCSEPMNPNDIRMILNDRAQYEKYQDFMVRRVLAVDPDTRWCPAPDCSYAVVATGCASCPKIRCERPGCGSYFCYHCKAMWHPNQTCDQARAQRSPNLRSSSLSFSQDSHSQHRSGDDIKPCPRCQAPIVKMDDGSCNHMICSVCGAEFCWLCMKVISDLHFLSPSGCTFWGKKPWSRKKKILWQLGILVGAPVGIGLVAGIAVPAIIIGIPVWVGRQLYSKLQHSNKHKRNMAIAGGVAASVVVSPVVAGLAVGIGVPILLFYVYGVVPVSLCRSGGCGLSAWSRGTNSLDLDDEADMLAVVSGSGSASASAHGSSKQDLHELQELHDLHDLHDTRLHEPSNPSIGEVSLSLGSGSQLERDQDPGGSASAIALAGSIASASLHGQPQSQPQPLPPPPSQPHTARVMADVLHLVVQLVHAQPSGSGVGVGGPPAQGQPSSPGPSPSPSPSSSPEGPEAPAPSLPSLAELATPSPSPSPTPSHPPSN